MLDGTLSVSTLKISMMPFSKQLVPGSIRRPYGIVGVQSCLYMIVSEDVNISDVAAGMWLRRPLAPRAARYHCLSTKGSSGQGAPEACTDKVVPLPAKDSVESL